MLFHQKSHFFLPILTFLLVSQSLQLYNSTEVPITTVYPPLFCYHRWTDNFLYDPLAFSTISITHWTCRIDSPRHIALYCIALYHFIIHYNNVKHLTYVLIFITFHSWRFLTGIYVVPLSHSFWFFYFILHFPLFLYFYHSFTDSIYPPLLFLISSISYQMPKVSSEAMEMESNEYLVPTLKQMGYEGTVSHKFPGI